MDCLLSDKHKCREVWSDRTVEIAFNILLDIILFIIPLIIMAFNYTVISIALNQQNNQYIRNYQNLCPNGTQFNDVSEQNSSIVDGSADSPADNGLVANSLVLDMSNDCQRPNHVVIKRNAHLFRDKLVDRQMLCSHFFVCHKYAR